MAPSPELARRLKKLQAGLKRRKLDGMLVLDRFNSFYMTGFASSLSYLLVTPREALLLVDGRYIEAARKGVKHCKVGLFTVLSKSLAEWQRRVKPKRMGFEGTIAWNDWKQFKELIPGIKWEEAGSLIQEQRIIKSPAEVKLLQASAQLNDNIYEAALAALRPGMTEIDVRNVIHREADRLGAQGLSFEAIIASGKTGSMPHYRPGPNPLRPKDLLLIDMGMLLGGYCSDMTRVVGLGRGVGAKMRKAFDAVLEAEEAALAEAGPGVKAADLHRIAQATLKRRGFEKYFTHGLGHGVGLEIHEAPRLNASSNEVLKPGMIVTIEPGVYLPGLGGVRIEDMIVITTTGHRSLSKAEKRYREIPFRG